MQVEGEKIETADGPMAGATGGEDDGVAVDELLSAADEAGSLVPVGERVPTTLLVLPLKKAVAFPGLMMPILLESERAQDIVGKVEKENGFLALLAQKDPEVKDPLPKDLFRIGVAGRVLRTLKLPDGRSSVMVQGVRRIEVERFARKQPYLIAKARPLLDEPGDRLRTEALVRNLQFLLKDIAEKNPMYGDDFSTAAVNIELPGPLADFAASYFVKDFTTRQKVLEAIAVEQRLEIVVEILTKELQVLDLGKKIQDEIRAKTEKLQKEYFLREQVKIIRRELGEEKDSKASEQQRLEDAIAAAGMPEEVERKAREEIAKLKTTPPESPEYTVLRNYLDWLTQVPWSKSTDDRRDLAAAAKILDHDHFALDEIKERILEFLAVRKLKPGHSGSILCFVGPPGVGKTSLGRSIARAMGRKFWRFSLGGMRDEAEIKGHRRTYIGAMPGRIIQGLKHTGTNNPVIMLDEIDKLGSDYRGDPSSALLEVLDPEQNHAFLDHYLDVPFDLSRVMFIATANALPLIPPPLQDRMEVIDVPGYLTAEKVEIAIRHLLPKQLENHGLDRKRLVISRPVLGTIIQSYTREAGVRNLEKAISRICRKAALRVARGDRRSVTVTRQSLKDFLGLPRVGDESARRVKIPGVARGLAWTPFGGEVLYIEASRSRGKGGFTMTGQLGEVMGESGRIALHYVRSHAERYGIQPALFEESDIHVHFPAGAIPKDGPSAGIAIASAILSLLMARPFPADLAMTGELTLVGEVLPIGGVREKVLAARRHRVRRIVLPADNRKDVDELKRDMKAGLRFTYVETFKDVFQEVFGALPPGARRVDGKRDRPIPEVKPAKAAPQGVPARKAAPGRVGSGGSARLQTR